MIGKLFFTVLVVLVIVFVFQNTEPVEVRFLVWNWAMSRALMFLGTFLIGVAAALLLRGPSRRR